MRSSALIDTFVDKLKVLFGSQVNFYHHFHAMMKCKLSPDAHLTCEYFLRHPNKVSVLCWSTSEQLRRISCFSINSASKNFPHKKLFFSHSKINVSSQDFARQKQKHQKTWRVCVRGCVHFYKLKASKRRILNYKALYKFSSTNFSKSFSPFTM